MKRFCITLHPARVRDMIFRHPVTGLDFIAYGHAFPVVGQIARPTEDPCPVYWADDEDAAKAMAALITYQKPGLIALVSETKWVYQTAIPEIALNTTISKFSAKGMLPE